MEQERSTRDQPAASRLSLAEEQRRAFEDDRKRVQPQGMMRFAGFLFRN